VERHGAVVLLVRSLVCGHHILLERVEPLAQAEVARSRDASPAQLGQEADDLAHTPGVEYIYIYTYTYICIHTHIYIYIW